MKVGILTFHYTNNPGSVLQAYALQQVIGDLGAECEIINYQQSQWLKKQYAPLVKRVLPACWRLVYLPVLFLIKCTFAPYDKFRKEYMEIKPRKRIEDHIQMTQIADGYDKLIAGSDQIWNLDNAKVSYIQFLNFCEDNSKKISYAASFGKNEVAFEHREAVAKLLKEFTYISTRESQGVSIVKELIGRDAKWVLDPTLLLDCEQWKKIARPLKKKKYILVYLRGKSALINRLATDLSRSTGLPVISIGGEFWQTAVGKQIICPGPLEWLGYFLNAKYVITNSFHGMAFSINFNKQFFALSLEQRGPYIVPNSRIFSILEQFGLQDRLITENTDFRQIPDIDYRKVNEILAEKRKESLSFLRTALGLDE